MIFIYLKNEITGAHVHQILSDWTKLVRNFYRGVKEGKRKTHSRAWEKL
jgi:hypothetical protein